MLKLLSECYQDFPSIWLCDIVFVLGDVLKNLLTIQDGCWTQGDIKNIGFNYFIIKTRCSEATCKALSKYVVTDIVLFQKIATQTDKDKDLT